MDIPELRIERAADHRTVEHLHVAAFAGHGPAVAALVAELRGQTVSPELSIVADVRGMVVGHVLLSACLIDAKRRLVSALVLSPLAVREDFRRRGIGEQLVRAGLDAADRCHFPLVILEGSPSYYGRIGFVQGRTLRLRRPSLRIPPEAFQARTLSSYEPWMTGTMVYPDLWWRHDLVGLRPLRGDEVSGHQPVPASSPHPSGSPEELSFPTQLRTDAAPN